MGQGHAHSPSPAPPSNLQSGQRDAAPPFGRDSYALHPRVHRESWLLAGGRQAFVLTFVMAGEGGGSVMWLRVEDEGIQEAKQLRVTVSAVEDGKGKEEEALSMQGYPSRQLKGGALGGLQALRCGAQSRPAALRDLRQKPLGDFRKQKRRREADNLIDSGEDDDEGGGHLCFSPPPPFILMLRQCLSRRTLDSKKYHARHGMCQTRRGLRPTSHSSSAWHSARALNAWS